MQKWSLAVQRKRMHSLKQMAQMHWSASLFSSLVPAARPRCCHKLRLPCVRIALPGAPSSYLPPGLLLFNGALTTPHTRHSPRAHSGTPSSRDNHCCSAHVGRLKMQAGLLRQSGIQDGLCDEEHDGQERKRNCGVLCRVLQLFLQRPHDGSRSHDDARYADQAQSRHDEVLGVGINWRPRQSARPGRGRPGRRPGRSRRPRPGARTACGPAPPAGAA